jgi:hypothetical protein
MRERDATRRSDQNASVQLHDLPDRINLGLPGSQRFDQDELIRGVLQAYDENLIFYDEQTMTVIFM